MSKEFVPITDYTRVSFKSFRAKTMLDFVAAGMHAQRRIEGFHTRTQNMKGRVNDPALIYKPDGAALRAERKARKMSQAVLARTVGVTPQNISSIEKGKSRTTVELWEKIRSVLDSKPE